MKCGKSVLSLVLMSGFIASPVLAKSQGEPGGEGVEEAAAIPDYARLDPTLKRMSKSALNPACPASGIVAFSVVGTQHISQGGATILGYSGTYSNTGDGWTPGGSTFIAPCAGLYVFTVSIVKTYSTSTGSTASDVYMYIYQNGISKGYAWAGAAADVARTTGTFTVALPLNEGDYIQTFTNSAGGAKRLLSKYDFTGYLVKPY